MKRSAPPKRRSPLRSRQAPIARHGRPKPVNRKRREKQFARAYHSVERVEFVKSLPCCVTGLVENIENAHIEGGGMSRKADYRLIVPLDHTLHLKLHTWGRGSFERLYGINLKRCADATEMAWIGHLARSGK